MHYKIILCLTFSFAIKKYFKASVLALRLSVMFDDELFEETMMLMPSSKNMILKFMRPK